MYCDSRIGTTVTSDVSKREVLAANLANKSAQKKRITYQPSPFHSPTLDNSALETKMAELARLYHLCLILEKVDTFGINTRSEK